MRLLLLGCTGFVGKELVPTLLKENHEIYIVSRKPISQLKFDLDFNKFKFLQIDLSKEHNWNNTLANLYAQRIKQPMPVGEWDGVERKTSK